MSKPSYEVTHCETCDKQWPTRPLSGEAYKRGCIKIKEAMRFSDIYLFGGYGDDFSGIYCDLGCLITRIVRLITARERCRVKQVEGG